jgi:hypothetical protein
MKTNSLRSDLMAMAKAECHYCAGAGMYQQATCACVCRAVFRQCYAKFKVLAAGGHLGKPISIDGASIPKGGRIGGWAATEYMADFCLIARRVLEPLEHQIFRFHFLLGADFRLCCRRLSMARGNFYHAVYRNESKLGRAFMETKPYGLWPLDAYFSSARQALVRPCPVAPMPHPNGIPLSPPLRKPPDPARRPLAPAPTPQVPQPVRPRLDVSDLVALQRQICQWFDEGLAFRTIVGRLNGHNAPAPGGKAWRTSLVKDMLLARAA